MYITYEIHFAKISEKAREDFEIIQFRTVIIPTQIVFYVVIKK